MTSFAFFTFLTSRPSVSAVPDALLMTAPPHPTLPTSH